MRGSRGPSSSAVEAGIAALDDRAAYRKAALDAIHHHAVTGEKSITELRRRIEPEQLRCDLSEDARTRGL